MATFIVHARVFGNWAARHGFETHGNNIISKTKINLYPIQENEIAKC